MTIQGSSNTDDNEIDFEPMKELEKVMQADSLENIVKPLRDRIVAQEILLQQKDMRIRHLEEVIKELRSGLKIGDKYKKNFNDI